MNQRELEAAAQAVAGWTYEEWRTFAMRVEQEFATARDAVRFTAQDAKDVGRMIAMQNGWIEPGETPRQTTMTL